MGPLETQRPDAGGALFEISQAASIRSALAVAPIPGILRHQPFSRRWGNKAAREISYQQIIYHFYSADFYLMQAQLKAIEKAQAKLDQVKFAARADITNRLPERPPRRRVKRETDFQI